MTTTTKTPTARADSAALATREAAIRRGDVVHLSDGKIAQVVSVTGGYIHTTEGTYGPWQVREVEDGAGYVPQSRHCDTQ